MRFPAHLCKSPANRMPQQADHISVTWCLQGAEQVDFHGNRCLRLAGGPRETVFEHEQSTERGTPCLTVAGAKRRAVMACRSRSRRASASPAVARWLPDRWALVA